MSYEAPAEDRARLFNTGDVVYFLLDGKADSIDGVKLEVMKGTVHITHRDGARLEEPTVRTWPSLDEEPSGIRISNARHPDTLLSEEEVLIVALENGMLDNPSADETIKANPDQLSVAIGTTLLLRQISRDLSN